MYRITVEDEFAGAHHLRNYRGKCENPHGHNWKVAVSLDGEEPGDNGLLIDFGDVRKILHAVLDELDHTDLNRVSFFRRRNPSSENIAFYLFQNMRKAMKKKGIVVAKVTVWENGRQSAAYWEKEAKAVCECVGG